MMKTRTYCQIVFTLYVTGGTTQCGLFVRFWGVSGVCVCVYVYLVNVCSVYVCFVCEVVVNCLCVCVFGVVFVCCVGLCVCVFDVFL